VLDLRVRQPLSVGLSVYLDVKNLTNTKAVDSYEVRGLTVFAGVSLDFESY
jgi:outer membrane receptor protein involved in Fe transport